MVQSLAPLSPTTKTAAEIGAVVDLTDPARELLGKDHTPDAFLAILVQRKLLQDAVKFAAHALPKKEAIAWSASCARQASGSSPPAKIEGALKAIQAWQQDPSDANRRAAHVAAQAAGLGTPAGCAALAVYLSEGSLAPAGSANPVPPGEFMAARAVAGAVLLAAVFSEPAKAEQKLQQFIQQAQTRRFA